MTLGELEVLCNLSFEDIDKDKLIDINKVIINQSIPKEERIIDFMKTAENPYFFKCGNVFVKVSFADTDLRLGECFHRYLNQCLDERL
jgi:hypothetical protein